MHRLSGCRLRCSLLDEIANPPMTREAAATGACAFGDLPYRFCAGDGDTVDDLRLRHCEATAEEGFSVQGMMMRALHGDSLVRGPFAPDSHLRLSLNPI